MSSKLFTLPPLHHPAADSEIGAQPVIGGSQQLVRGPDLAALRRGTRPPNRRVTSAHTTLSAHGAPLVWLTGGALATAVAMIVGLLVLVLYEGLQTFWPLPVVQMEVSNNSSSGASSTLLGEIARSESFRAEPEFLEKLKQQSPELFDKAETEMKGHDGKLRRQLIWTGRTSGVDFAGSRALWVNDYAIGSTTRPEWAMVIERLDGGRTYGTPVELLVDGKAIADGPQQVWEEYNKYHSEVMKRLAKSVSLDRNGSGAIDRRERSARLTLVDAQLRLKDAQRNEKNTGDEAASAKATVDAKQKAYDAVESEAADDKGKISAEIKQLETENARYEMRVTTASGETIDLPLANIVRAYPANTLSLAGKLGVYASRWWEFLTADPRESNTEGGVFPAIWGTVAMTLIMSVLVVPFGVLAALYLREYAQAGAVVSAIRISINNLAGVPSIVFGVFGLGLFCYVIGASIDQLFFRAALSEGTPTFGTGGIMWASLTLALLTLPVVIVATEEALAAVPNSMREGSYACGASKWQTIRRIVLPRAMPGIMTGMILAMARGAGEVAPLLLVGVKDLAPALPVDGVFPYVHPQRSFMHLAYQIYIVGFKSPNAEAAKPMVFTTTLLLIVMVAMLSITAVYLRGRLRRRFVLTQF
jgi:phosphate transport system permease protein